MEKDKKHYDGPWWVLRDTRGGRSTSFTFAVVSFFLCSLWFLISFVNIKIGSWQPREFEPTAALAFLGSALGNYFGRRFTESKFPQANGHSTGSDTTTGTSGLPTSSMPSTDA